MQTLYSKLTLVLAVLLFLVGLLHALMTKALVTQSYQSGNQQLNRSLAADLVAEMELVKHGAIDRMAMAKAFHLLNLLNPSIDIYYLDKSGNILDSSIAPQKVHRSTVALEPIEQFFAGNSMYPLSGDDPAGPERSKPFSVIQLPSAENPQGYLYVVLQGVEFDQYQMREQSRTIQTLGMRSLAGSLIIGLLIGLVLFYRLTCRIRKLNQAMDVFHRSGFTCTKETLEHLSQNRNNNDEISQLVRSFDELVRHISKQYVQLKNQDQVRREMIANVSHDLRTPLAAMHGYIERLREKFDTLSVQERKQFLDISLRHSTRLNDLIASLFELSKLEACEMKANLEPFSLPELVQDVLQKFRLSAEARGIRLRFMHDKHVPLVSGDIALLDRALSNLIDNAIEHTNEGGHISLFVQSSGNKVSVKVQDNGHGIAPQHIKAIFQRFYHVGNQHRGEGKHAGLGLAITQRILALHGQAIKVYSKLNQGTTFQFFMPVWDSEAIIASR